MARRGYRTITLILDEYVSFEEAAAVLRACRMIRGISEAHLNDLGGLELRAPSAHPQTDPAQLEP